MQFLKLSSEAIRCSSQKHFILCLCRQPAQNINLIDTTVDKAEIYSDIFRNRTAASLVGVLSLTFFGGGKVVQLEAAL